MGHSTLWYEKEGLKRGPWTAEEDQKLTAYIQQHGHGSWSTLPGKAGLKRCGKSCRLRWVNYLRPDIKRGKFSLRKEQIIIQLHAFLGNRTDNEIKNHWNTNLKKRLIKMGIDPMTHKPGVDALGTFGDECHEANLNHMAQWERARLESEARAALQNRVRIQPNICSGIDPLPLTPRPKCIDVLKAWQGMVNPSNAPIQVSIGQTVVDSNAATNHPSTCNELVFMDEWKRFNQTQELEDWIDESTTSSTMEVEESNGSCPIADNGSHSVWMFE